MPPPPISRYINPYTDFGFKKLFGEEANKGLLIDFLNAVLPPENHIADLKFNNPEQLPDNIVDRRAIFDIFCTGSNGESFTVEMQKAKDNYFKDRALFYSSYPIQRQTQKNDWNFKLNPVFFVAVLDFVYDEQEERRKLYRHVTLKDQDGELFSRSLQMIFLQMPLFTLTESELVTPKDKWLYFLKNLWSFEDIPKIFRESVFEKAFHTAEYLQLSPKEQAIYQWDLNIQRENHEVIRTARDDGIAEGEARGKAEGEAKRSYEMKAKGLDAALIAEMTGLSLQEIEQINDIS